MRIRLIKLLIVISCSKKNEIEKELLTEIETLINNHISNINSNFTELETYIKDHLIDTRFQQPVYIKLESKN